MNERMSESLSGTLLFAWSVGVVGPERTGRHGRGMVCLCCCWEPGAVSWIHGGDVDETGRVRCRPALRFLLHGASSLPGPGVMMPKGCGAERVWCLRPCPCRVDLVRGGKRTKAPVVHGARRLPPMPPP